MAGERFFAASLLGLVVVLVSAGPGHMQAQTAAAAALTGQVSSQEEGPMEGVLVSARREGAKVTITVVSDAQGRYSFPRTRLEPGRYSLRIRAVGYDLNDPGSIEITTEKTTQLDLTLRKTQDLASQLTSAEWIMSIPGTAEQKKTVFFVEGRCVECHTLERIVRSRYDAEGLKQVLLARRMVEWAGEQMRRNTEYLSTINRSTVSTWQYPLKTLPRPQGKATRVIITEYDLPRPDTEPHDVVMDAKGMAWYADFRQQYVGRLDPKTGKIVEWPVPMLKPRSPGGLKDVRFDRDGNVWLDMMDQAGIAKFDKKTQEFQAWSVPKEVNKDKTRIGAVVPQQHHVDGKVWTKYRELGERRSWGLLRLDVQSGQMEIIDPKRDIPRDSPAAMRPHSCYGIAADSRNNVYCMDLSSEYIVKVDAKTLKATFNQTPTFDSGPRRGHMDSQDQLWFAEYRGNKIGMFDTKTERFQEWAIPTPWSGSYDAILDKNGEAWAGGMWTDRVARLNPKTGEFIEYLLPRSTNIRRVDVDNSTNPVTFWVGNNHGASVIRLEPLE